MAGKVEEDITAAVDGRFMHALVYDFVLAPQLAGIGRLQLASFGLEGAKCLPRYRHAHEWLFLLPFESLGGLGGTKAVVVGDVSTCSFTTCCCCCCFYLLATLSGRTSAPEPSAGL